MSRVLLFSVLLLGGFLLTACDPSDPGVEPEMNTGRVHVKVAEKDGADAPWITWQESFSEYNENGQRVSGQLYLYEDDGSTRFIRRDTTWYAEDGTFQRRHFWTQDISEGDPDLSLDEVIRVEEGAGDASLVVVSETADGEPLRRTMLWYENGSSETKESIYEIWRNGAWERERRTVYLERDAAGRVLLRQTEEWIDGTWRIDRFFDQIERDENGRVIRAEEDGRRPMTFAYTDDGRIVEKTKRRSRHLRDRWQYEYTNMPVQKSGPLDPVAAFSRTLP